MIDSQNHVLIMAGGVGSRFWPKSRNDFPKQFIDMLGVGKSLLQLTYERFLKLIPADNIHVITNVQYKALVQEQLPSLKAENILSEPSRNNTAPCIAYAAFKLLAKDPNARMVVAPSDHFILYEDIFLEKIKQGLELAATEDVLLTLGITPTRPDTGYGYINFDKEGRNGVHKVNCFKEKPHFNQAQEYLESGDYVWNAGIFIWKAQAIVNAFEKMEKGVFDLFKEGWTYYNTPEEQTFIDKHYPLSPKISIDYAIMEKADNVYTIPADFGWSDMGTWTSLFEHQPKELGNNAVSSNRVYLEETSNCLISLQKEKLAIIRGLQDFIIVDDNNVLLIYPKAMEQEIKKVTEMLNKGEHANYL
ncbi:mannose-1-phosphate guanylyltransferase [Chitinophaga sp. HK235]|uniref:mannose-1-phosphate guanylyltransferase n=1 Tax=Chitinophaga sp. HK235 TaxID=2952571 RepID=UPI001BA810FF|nr:mannose-1-phosphate guanylyltransferase [Chitinophaga sp. HK235]